MKTIPFTWNWNEGNIYKSLSFTITNTTQHNKTETKKIVTWYKYLTGTYHLNWQISINNTTSHAADVRKIIKKKKNSCSFQLLALQQFDNSVFFFSLNKGIRTKQYIKGPGGVFFFIIIFIHNDNHQRVKFEVYYTNSKNWQNSLLTS